MKTEYKILWIDDNIKYVRGDIRTITRFLSDYGVDLSLKTLEVDAENTIVDNSEFIKSLEEGGLDFLLIDLNMPGLNGIEVISHIRTTLKDYQQKKSVIK